MKRKICIVTGTRAEYGLLRPLMEKIQLDSDLELQVIVTGMHLSPEFGLTYKQIEEDGFVIDEKVETLLSSDTGIGVSKSMGLTTIGFADVLNRLKPDLLIILGDRFEMLSIAQVALIMQIPIAHIAGGECTFGAYDDAIRHSITKMSNFHFVSTEGHFKRVVQLGENPERVFNIGAPGIEQIKNLSLLPKEELLNELNIETSKSFFLITYHPETNGNYFGIEALLNALEKYKDKFYFIFTKSNADNGGREINGKVSEYVYKNRDNAHLFDSLGQLKYLSAAKAATLVIGNSSSGLVEVPYLETPTINCGDRQLGRERPESVIDCSMTEETIIEAIEKGLNYTGIYSELFGNGEASSKILKVLKSFKSFKIRKEFYDL